VTGLHKRMASRILRLRTFPLGVCLLAAAAVLLCSPTALGGSGESNVVELEVPTGPRAQAKEAPSDLRRIARLLERFRLASQEQDLTTIAPLLSCDLAPAKRREQLTRVRESLWLPMYRLYGLRVEEALDEIDPEDLVKGALHLRIAVDTPSGHREHDDFWLRRETCAGAPPRWAFSKFKLERPKKGEYITLPVVEADQVLTTVEQFTSALDAGDARSALELAWPRLSGKQRRELAEEIEDRFLRRYLYRTDLGSGRPVRRPDSVRYMLVVSHEEAPGSIFRYYDHGEIAVPFNLHYLKPRGFTMEEKAKKYALVFRWEETPDDEAGGGRWELIDTTRRDKGFWKGVGRAFAAFGKGTAKVAGGVLVDLPALAPSHARILIH